MEGVRGGEKRRWRDGIFGSSDGAAVMGVGGRREGAWERAAVHSAAATWGRALDKGQHEHITHPPTPSFSQVNGYMTAVDVRRIYPRYCASRGGQCASRVLLGGLGGQLLTDWWEVGYITRMCPFRPCSRHMQQMSGQYWKIVFCYPLINALCS